MVLALVIALLSGQVIYEWIDSKGESHFTNDVNSIPAKAKRRVTAGADLVVVAAKADAGVSVKADAGATAPLEVDSCALARQLVSQLEREVEQAKAQGQQDDDRERLRCQEALRLQGDFGYARCMSSRTAQVPPGTAAATKLEEARETLRRAQVSGCR
ncbi:MAG: DUF4124 domain-containing protein [Archangium sp.]|nr:DUF4124 domain-containing protein [Archangium sp.]